jgi:hypothetical protein
MDHLRNGANGEAHAKAGGRNTFVVDPIDVNSR